MIYEVQGGYYHNRENAYDAALEFVTEDELYEYISYHISYEEILKWGLQNGAFLKHFQEQISDAEQEAANELYLQEVEFYDDDEEEEFKTTIEFLDNEEE